MKKMINKGRFQKGHKHSKNWYKAMKSRIPWNKGLHIKNNDALAEWKNNGGEPWNKDKHTGVKPWLNKKRPDMAGKKHPNWKGGVTTKNQKERVRFRKVFQKSVFERDDYTCQICGKKGGNLHVDHLKNWSKFPEFRFDLDNCRTLCIECHYYITWGRKMPKEIKTWGQNLEERVI